jgi:hypothetical protein
VRIICVCIILFNWLIILNIANLIKIPLTVRVVITIAKDIEIKSIPPINNIPWNIPVKKPIKFKTIWKVTIGLCSIERFRVKLSPPPNFFTANLFTRTYKIKGILAINPQLIAIHPNNSALLCSKLLLWLSA